MSNLETVYGQYMAMINKQIAEGEQPMIIAAAMATLALRLYKTTLSAGDYENMMQAIYDSRDQIQSLVDHSHTVN